MTVSVDASVQSQIEAPVFGVLYLVELAFTSGTLRVTNYPVSLTALGHDWQGLGQLAAVSELKESEDGRAQKVELTLSQVPLTNIALALGNVSSYQGRSARIYVAVMDEAFHIVGAPVLRFAGFMDVVRIQRDGQVGKVMLECQSGAYDVRSNPAALRMNDAQHKARHPGERGFEYVPSLIGKPQSWLSTRFQQI